MIELFSCAETARLERRRKAGMLLAALSALAGLTACIVLCCMTSTANAAHMEPTVIAAGVLGGWLAFAFWSLVAQDAKLEKGHAQMLLAGERTAVPGTVCVTDERLRIRGSITIRKVTVDNGTSVRKLNVNERKAKALQAAGPDITLYAVNGYAAAYETNTPPAAPLRTPLHARLWRKLLSQLPLYLVWMILGAMLWSWIFGLVTDTRPEKKVTVFVDAYGVEDTALAVELERELPPGVRMVKVHPVDYVMFDDAALRDADIFILRASDAETYDELLAPADGSDVLTRGVKIYDAATGRGAAQSYILYVRTGAPAEDYYLFVGANSLHTGAVDDAAHTLAERIKKLP